MDETVVYLIRHSEFCPKNNFNYIKVSDNKRLLNEKAILSVTGEKKAEKMSKLEELKDINAIYSSNYVRTLSTVKYIAYENNLVINIDERLNERKIGDLDKMEAREFHRLQANNFDFKLPNGESLNQTKKRMVEAMKSILMFEAGNRVVVASHSTALMCLLSSWCELGHNYNDDIILSYKDETIVDGRWDAPMIFKVVFEGLNVKDIKVISLNDKTIKREVEEEIEE